MHASIQQRDILSRNFRILASPVLILGAAYSGKSELACNVLEPSRASSVIGTADRNDAELNQRIAALQAARPANWHSYDAALDLLERFRELQSQRPQLLIDSLNQWMAQLIFDGIQKYSDTQLLQHLQSESNTLLQLITEFPKQNRLVMISSEVGASLSPSALPARIFRQATSRLNCQVAERCRSVILVSAGIPLVVKALPPEEDDLSL